MLVVRRGFYDHRSNRQSDDNCGDSNRNRVWLSDRCRLLLAKQPLHLVGHSRGHTFLALRHLFRSGSQGRRVQMMHAGLESEVFAAGAQTNNRGSGVSALIALIILLGFGIRVTGLWWAQGYCSIGPSDALEAYSVAVDYGRGEPK